MTLLLTTLLLATSTSMAQTDLDRAIVAHEAFRQTEAANQVVLLNEILPRNLKPGNSEAVIAEKFALRSADTLIQNIHIKNATAKAMAQAVSNGVAVNTDFNFLPSADGKPAHKVSIEARLATSEAKLSYVGVVDATLKYSMAKNEALFNINEKVAENTTLQISQSLANEDTTTNVSFSLNY